MKFFIIALLLLTTPTLRAAKMTSLTPPMKKKLDVIGGSLDTESMIALSMAFSEQFKIISSDKFLIPTYRHNSLVPLDTNLAASRSKSYLLSPQGMTEYRYGINKYFISGTNVEVNAVNNSFGNAAEISISQSLLTDFLGSSARRAKLIGNLTSDAKLNFFKDSIENWMLGVVKFYYQAHTSKLKSKVLEENIKSKQRLLNITNVKLRRGTAEEGDLLKAKSSLTAAKIQYNQIQQALSQFWNELAVQIKFEPEWLNVDPNIIPMKTDSMFENSLELCKKDSPSTSLEIKAYESQSKAFDLEVKNRRRMLLPKLDFLVQYQAPLEDRPDDWHLGFRFSYPLFSHKAKSDLLTTYANEQKSKAQLLSLKNEIKKNWLNTCSKLSFLNESVELKKETIDNYEKIMTLEQKRYSIGRSSILQIIQIGDEQMMANLDFVDSNEALRVAGWEVAKLSNTLEEYLKTLEDKYKNLSDKML